MIWFMVKELQANGGSNYSATLDSTLVSDATNFAGQWNTSNRRTAELAIYRNNAVAAGATVPLDPSELFDNVKCLQNVPRWTLEKIFIMLLCKLGVHADYPQ